MPGWVSLLWGAGGRGEGRSCSCRAGEEDKAGIAVVLLQPCRLGGQRGRFAYMESQCTSAG